MTTLSPALRTIFGLATTHAILTRIFDAGLGGLGFTECMILYHLKSAPDQQLRRIDLAEKVGLTPSGVTRLLLPMEKIGLVTSGTAGSDARVRSVMISNSGQQKLEEALERAELLLEDLIPQGLDNSAFSTFINAVTQRS